MSLDESQPNVEPSVTTPPQGHLAPRQAGYLPIPLKYIPPEVLSELNVYLYHDGQYALYNAQQHSFDQIDQRRLLSSGVETVYVSVRDHRRYYRTLEKHLGKLLRQEGLAREQKSELLYATAMELAGEVLSAPPGPEEIIRVAGLSSSMVDFLLQDDEAFDYLSQVSHHDFYTATHMVNVCYLTVATAEKLGFSAGTTINLLALGAMLHDVGKVFIDPLVLNMPGPLSDIQNKLIRQHVTLGRDHLLKTANLETTVIEAVEQHHERLDGSGYPLGLKGEQISLAGRLAAVVDTFEAMTSVRPYRENVFSVSQTLDYLRTQADQLYDASAVNALVNVVETQPAKPSLVTEDKVNRPLRRFERRYMRLTVQVRSAVGSAKGYRLSPPQRVMMHNLSQSGVGFLSSRPFRINTVLQICLPAINNQPAQTLNAVVVRSQDHGDGWFTHGCRLEKLLTAEQVEMIQSGVGATV